MHPPQRGCGSNHGSTNKHTRSRRHEPRARSKTKGCVAAQREQAKTTGRVPYLEVSEQRVVVLFQEAVHGVRDFAREVVDAEPVDLLQLGLAEVVVGRELPDDLVQELRIRRLPRRHVHVVQLGQDALLNQVHTRLVVDELYAGDVHVLRTILTPQSQATTTTTVTHAAQHRCATLQRTGAQRQVTPSSAVNDSFTTVTIQENSFS